MDDWFETIASLGMIVVSSFMGYSNTRCRGSDGQGHAWMDILSILETAYNRSTELHPVFAKADWKRVGVMGHSLGAMAATQAAYKMRRRSVFPLKDAVKPVAVVASHDSLYVRFIHGDVATMLLTGTRDLKYTEERAYDDFVKCASSSKVLASFYRGHHMEPAPREKLGWGHGGARLNWFSAQFLSCHVGRNPEHCETIYGTGEDSMLAMHHWSMFIAQTKGIVIDNQTVINKTDIYRHSTAAPTLDVTTAAPEDMPNLSTDPLSMQAIDKLYDTLSEGQSVAIVI